MDAPVIYAAKMRPDGKSLFGIHANKREGKSYENMAEAVKAMTGRDFTDFQCSYKGTKVPFVVTPTAK